LKNILFNTALCIGIGESIGLSYKNKFINDPFYKKEKFFKEELKSYGSCRFEIEPFNYSDNTVISLIILNNFANNGLKLNSNSLLNILNQWFDEFDPFNLDGPLRMKMFSNSIDYENFSSYYLLRLILPIIFLKEKNIDKEIIKKEIFEIAKFTNLNNVFNRVYNLFFDLIYEDKETLETIFNRYKEMIEYIFSLNEIISDDIYSTLYILIKELQSNRNIDESIKNIIFINKSPELCLSLFLSISFLRDNKILTNININNYLLKENVKKLENIILDIQENYKKWELYNNDLLKNNIKEDKNDTN